MDKLIAAIKYYSDRRFSTVAGTLVYFLLMSIAPFILWLTLVFGDVNVEQFFSHRLFAQVEPILGYLKNSAESAAGGAGIIFLVTSLYSSTNFFYHLRRSGEIIYNSKSVRGGVKLRIASVALIAATIVIVALIGTITVAGTTVLNAFMPQYLADSVFIIFVTVLAFCAAVILNVFACPFKMKLREAVTGSLLTTLLWLLFIIGFGVYSSFANPERLYGKLAALIIFLLWCYAMMSCFVIGMIKNGSLMSGRYEYKTL